jgi:hypothetical protein
LYRLPHQRAKHWISELCDVKGPVARSRQKKFQTKSQGDAKYSAFTPKTNKLHQARRKAAGRLSAGSLEPVASM